MAPEPPNVNCRITPDARVCAGADEPGVPFWDIAQHQGAARFRERRCDETGPAAHTDRSAHHFRRLFDKI